MRRSAFLGLLSTAIFVLVGCSPPVATSTPTLPTPEGLTPAGSEAPTAAASLFALTSPMPPPRAITAGETAYPALEPGGELTPDAVKVLTMASLQVSLAAYRTTTGAYPAILASLYPIHPPVGPGGQPLPQSVLTEYAYSVQGGNAYTLSVALSDGTTYSVHGTGGP